MIQAAAGNGVDEIVDYRPTPREIPRLAPLACAPGHRKIVA
jgi:hypothetical protein